MSWSSIYSFPPVLLDTLLLTLHGILGYNGGFLRVVMRMADQLGQITFSHPSSACRRNAFALSHSPCCKRVEIWEYACKDVRMVTP